MRSVNVRLPDNLYERLLSLVSKRGDISLMVRKGLIAYLNLKELANVSGEGKVPGIEGSGRRRASSAQVSDSGGKSR